MHRLTRSVRAPSPSASRARLGMTFLTLIAFVGAACGSGTATPSAPPAATAPAGTAPASPQDPLAEWVAAAEQEGTLTFYGSITPAQHEQIIAAFNEIYPNIKVEFLRLSTGELGQRYAAEAEIGQVVADVISLSDPVWFRDAAAKGWLTSAADLPSRAEIPDQFSEDMFTTFYVTPYVLGYNTTLVAPTDVPDDLDDLLDPKWKGLVLMIDPAVSSSQVAWMQMVVEDKGIQYLEQLKDNLEFTPSGVPGIQQVGAGAAAFLLATPASNVLDQQNEGAPVQFVYIPPITGQVGSMGVSADAPHPNAAKVFANFLLTEPAQAVLAQSGTPVLAGVDGPFPLDERFTPVDVEDGVANRAALLAAVGVEE
jgi:iron(III) transport system substrate-binding protein